MHLIKVQYFLVFLEMMNIIQDSFYKNLSTFTSDIIKTNKE